MSNPSLPDADSDSQPLFRKDVVFRTHPRAKRYLAKVDREGNIVLTVPRAGTQRDALAFANAHRVWLREQRAHALEVLRDSECNRGLREGDSIWYRGERVPLRLEKDLGRPVLCFADSRIFIADESMDLSRPLQRHLSVLAKGEFPAVVKSLADRFGLAVRKVSVRDQRTRWGSCSTSGTISLNWRLVMASDATRDYVIIHELMHMKRFDHSPEFWKMVAAACPNYREHEAWLKKHQDDLAW